MGRAAAAASPEPLFPLHAEKGAGAFPCRFQGTKTHLPPLPHRVHSFLADANLDAGVRSSQLRIRTTPTMA